MMTSKSALSSAVDGASARFRSALAQPAALQAQHLRRIVLRNQSSSFGREHGFASIRDAADFARHVPIRDYESLSPWIDRAASGEAHALTEEPIVAFEETGGSSAGPKLVPCTASGLAEFQAGLRPWLDDLFIAVPGLDRGSFYWAISPACRPPRRTRGGVPIGMAGDEAYFGEDLASQIVAALAVTPDVAHCVDVVQWRVRTLVQLLAREDLAMISVWSPTFLTELLDHAVAQRDELAGAMQRSGAANSARAKWVVDALGACPPRFDDVWPGLRVISCWDQASSAAPAAAIREAFPSAFVQGKGLLATEGLCTIPLHDRPWSVLSLESGYFEFRGDDGQVHAADDLHDDRDYELIVTNGNGFYRYSIGDRVRVRGFAERTPMLEFRGRGNGNVDLCGEKLTEAFVLNALAPLGVRFAALAADRESMRYVLLLDAEEVSQEAGDGMLARVEHGLARNPQYGYARRLLQLREPVARRVVRPVSRWIQTRLRRGQRLGDIKPPALLDDTDLRDMLAP